MGNSGQSTVVILRSFFIQSLSVLGNKEHPNRPLVVSPAFDIMMNSLLQAPSGTLYLCRTQHTLLTAGWGEGGVVNQYNLMVQLIALH